MDRRLQSRFGRRLRARRLVLKMSQESLSDYLGVHRTFISGLERGERNVTLQTVERLSLRLDIDPMKLLRADDSELTDS